MLHYRRAMPAAVAPPEFDPPDPERVHRNYVAQCRRLGVTPAPKDRAKAAIQQWADALAAARAAPSPDRDGRDEAGERT